MIEKIIIRETWKVDWMGQNDLKDNRNRLPRNGLRFRYLQTDEN